jgi:Glycosyl hydrolase family 99/Bacterial SH3 domain
MSRRFTRTLLLLTCGLVLSLISSASARANVTPRVLAFYYAWFDANTWNPKLVSDLPVQPYASADPAAIARQIQQAQGAGIDAFVVSWLGPNNPTDTNFKTMLGLAQHAGFAATIDFEAEQYGSRDAVINALTYVQDNLMNQSAFLRSQAGKPILFFWREQNFSISDWETIRNAVDPNHQQIWIAEGVDISYQQVFDGHHLYSIAWSPDVNYTLSNWANRVHQEGADKIWVATVMPGYDDTRTARPDRFARARNNGDFYRTTWQAAINTNPDFIIIDSFNEWVEGSMIEPSVTYGNLYLDLTRQFAAQFKSGAPPAPVAVAQAAPPAPTRTPTATPTPLALEPDQRLTTDVLRVREGPGTDYTTLGRLRANHTIQILARTDDSTWLQIAYPDADHTGWVSAEFVAPQTGLDDFPVFETETAPTDTPTDTPTAPDAPRDYSSYDYPYPPWY